MFNILELYLMVVIRVTCGDLTSFVGRNIGLDLLTLAGCAEVRLLDWRDPLSWNGREKEADKAKEAGKLQFVKVGGC